MWKAKGIKRSNSCQLFHNASGLHLLHCAQTDGERGGKADTTSNSKPPIRTNWLLNREIVNSGSSGKYGIRLCLYLHLSQRATFPVLQTPQEGVIRFFLHWCLALLQRLWLFVPAGASLGKLFSWVLFLLLAGVCLSKGYSGPPSWSSAGVQGWGWPGSLQRPASLCIRQHLARKGNCTATDLQLPTPGPMEKNTCTGDVPSAFVWGSEHVHPRGASLDTESLPGWASSLTHHSPKLWHNTILQIQHLDYFPPRKCGWHPHAKIWSLSKRLMGKELELSLILLSSHTSFQPENCASSKRSSWEKS